MSDMPPDINTLYRAALEGNRCAESELFRLLSDSFGLFVRRRISSRSDCEEVVQDALAAIAERYRSVKIESSFASWVYELLHNKVVDYYRSQNTRSTRLTGSMNSQFKTEGSIEGLELRRRLLDCLKKLNDATRFHARALNLHYQGYSTADICKRLGMTQNNFYVVLSRARRMLQRCLEEGGIEL